jgi:hypothetical protein
MNINFAKVAMGVTVVTARGFATTCKCLHIRVSVGVLITGFQSEWYSPDGRTRKWECGMPREGKSGGPLNSDGPVNERGYAPGDCSIHVTHFQKPDPSKDSYSLDLKVYDNNENEIGGSGKVGPNHSLASKLPYTVEVTTGGVDADPVRFGYAGFEWDSNSPNCRTGGYGKIQIWLSTTPANHSAENGDREMDCTFHCD